MNNTTLVYVVNLAYPTELKVFFLNSRDSVLSNYFEKWR